MLWHWRGTHLAMGKPQYFSRITHSACSFLYNGTGWFYPYTTWLLHWHWGNHKIATEPVKQPWRIWVNKSHEHTRKNKVTTTKQSTTKPCGYFMGYTATIMTIAQQNHEHNLWDKLCLPQENQCVLAEPENNSRSVVWRSNSISRPWCHIIFYMWVLFCQAFPSESNIELAIDISCPV